MISYEDLYKLLITLINTLSFNYGWHKRALNDEFDGIYNITKNLYIKFYTDGFDINLNSNNFDIFLEITCRDGTTYDNEDYDKNGINVEELKLFYEAISKTALKKLEYYILKIIIENI